MRKISGLISLTIVLILEGCASAFSGSAPIPLSENNDPVRAVKRLDNLSIPRIAFQLTSKPVLIYKVAFDGTGNDKADVTQTKLETAVGFIANQLDGTHYYKGPGTESNYIFSGADAAIGFTSRSISRRASDDFNSWVAAHQIEVLASDVRIAVFGFSRGSAIARDFMNLVSREWPARYGEASGPRFYALLYDTVPGRQENNLNLSLPKSVDYLLHFVALDERRPQFQLYVDAPVNDSILGDEPQSVPQRINLVLFPGAHADLGGGYGSGVEIYYKLAAAKVLVDLGISDKNCWSLSGDALAGGMHDSRGWFNKLSGIVSPADDPNVARVAMPIESDVLSAQEQSVVDNRLARLSDARTRSTVPFASARKELGSNVFEVVRVGNILEATHHFTNLSVKSTVTYEVIEGIRRLHVSYDVRGVPNEENLIVPEAVWNSLVEGKSSTLEYRVGQINGKTLFDVLLNKKRMQTYVANDSKETTERVELLPCR
jgi:hypothetical protein